MEGMSRAVAIYRASTGALAYGPYDGESFFAPVSNSGDFFGFPQTYYDTMRDRWVVAMLHNGAGGLTYLDIAVSVSNSPTQPTPGGQYYIYQLATNFEMSGSNETHCASITLGADYWGLYFTCVNNTIGFVGNTMLAVSKADMYSGGDYTAWIVNDGLQRAAGGPAYATSPAIEEGGRTPVLPLHRYRLWRRQFKHGPVRLDQPQQHDHDAADRHLPEGRSGLPTPIHFRPGSHLRQQSIRRMVPSRSTIRRDGSISRRPPR